MYILCFGVKGVVQFCITCGRVPFVVLYSSWFIRCLLLLSRSPYLFFIQHTYPLLQLRDILSGLLFFLLALPRWLLLSAVMLPSCIVFCIAKFFASLREETFPLLLFPSSLNQKLQVGSCWRTCAHPNKPQNWKWCKMKPEPFRLGYIGSSLCAQRKHGT